MNLHTLLRGKTALAMALCAAACSQFSSAQVAPPVILQIDLANNVVYFQDTTDVSKYATEPNVTPPTAIPRNFYRVEGIADIVAVNGQPVKGTYANAAAAIVLRTAPTPGQAIADTVRQAITRHHLRNLEKRRHLDRNHCREWIARRRCAARISYGCGGRQLRDHRWYGSVSRRSRANVSRGCSAGSGYTTECLHHRGPREPPTQWRRNRAVDRPRDPNGAPRSYYAPIGSRHHPFQRLLSCHGGQAGNARRDLVALCHGPRPGHRES